MGAIKGSYIAKASPVNIEGGGNGVKSSSETVAPSGNVPVSPADPSSDHPLLRHRSVWSAKDSTARLQKEESRKREPKARGVTSLTNGLLYEFSGARHCFRFPVIMLRRRFRATEMLVLQPP